MSMLNKYLRNTTNSYTNKLNNNKSGSNSKSGNNLSTSSCTSSSSSSSSSSHSSSTSSQLGGNNNNNNMSSMGKFEFKPFVSSESNNSRLSIGGGGGVVSKFASSQQQAAQLSKNENRVNSLLHSTVRNGGGKILKRKTDKNTISAAAAVSVSGKKLAGSALIKCFNLAEKEKYQQLLAQTISKSSLESKNAYQNLIRSSPTRTRDDNILNEGRQQFQTLTPKLDQHDSVSSQQRNKISTNYSRRISLSQQNDSKADLATRNRTSAALGLLLPSAIKPASSSERRRQQRAVANESLIDLIDDDVEETSSTPAKTIQLKKVAQKRPQTQIPEINLADDDDEEDQVVAKIAPFNKANRPLSEFEKKLSERQTQTNMFLETLHKTQLVSKDVQIEEERYKYKKRQRMEKERLENALAINFIKMKIDQGVSYVNRLHFREEELIEEIEEDEFPELSEEQEKCIEGALRANQNQVLSQAFNADINGKDIQTLRGLNWLNDEIINFYMNLVCERSRELAESSPDYKRCYAFSTFFYPKLAKEGYSQSLKRWTRKVDLFAHDLILIPVHLGLHWTLAVIDISSREIRYYDSMNGHNNECLKLLKNYIRDEYADKKGGAQLDVDQWSCIAVRDVPQQMNGSDCGMFTCKYAEYLSRGRNQFNFSQAHMPYFRRRMIWEILNKKLL